MIRFETNIETFNAFYPTYEEWKQRFKIIITHNINPFYPTYEEWKHWSGKNTLPSTLTFYPTYEEWKQIFCQRQEC